MKNLTKLATVVLMGAAVSAPAFANLDEDKATVSMNVGLYASITGLNDFILSTSAADGSANAVYAGSDDFQLESNGQVRVSLSGGNLSNGLNEVATTFDMDTVGLTFDTTADSVHLANHTVSAEAVLGDISSQQAGAYQSEITLTVSAI